MIRNRLISNILVICLLVSVIPQRISAEPIYQGGNASALDTELNDVLNESSTVAVNSMRTVDDVIAQLKFSRVGGHGFAAEQGNNFIDSIKGHNTIVVGDNNVKNGPDRMIISRDGTPIFIQDKYYNSASNSIAACFDDTGAFRYIDSNGNIMQIEVPSDQYEQAVALMEQKIIEGRIPGVNDPKEARNIVRKGNLTYKQAVNLAKAGTVESLTYDAVHGVISAGCAFGISTLINYAVLRIGGEDRGTAIKESAISGVKTGIGVFCTAVIAGQLSKTGLLNVFKPSSEALARALGDDFSRKLIEAFGQKVLAAEGASTAESISIQAAKIIRTEGLIAVVSLVVFSVPDAIDMFRGRISRTQFVKNFVVTAITIAAGTAGYAAGAIVGDLIVPGVGSIPGGIIGSLIAGTGAGFVADSVADYITDDDAYVMYDILEEEFIVLCDEYLVNESEAQNVADALSSHLNEDAFKDMYQSNDREAYAVNLLTPLFEEEIAKRETIDLPSEEEMRNALKEELYGVVFIH